MRMHRNGAIGRGDESYFRGFCEEELLLVCVRRCGRRAGTVGRKIRQRLRGPEKGRENTNWI
jgi:hypothetical protein